MEHIALKKLVDLVANWYPITQKWDKMVDDLQKITKFKVPHNGKMCKDKWNGFNFEYKKVVDYHARTCHCAVHFGI